MTRGLLAWHTLQLQAGLPSSTSEKASPSTWVPQQEACASSASSPKAAKAVCKPEHWRLPARRTLSVGVGFGVAENALLSQVQSSILQALSSPIGQCFVSSAALFMISCMKIRAQSPPASISSSNSRTPKSMAEVRAYKIT